MTGEDDKYRPRHPPGWDETLAYIKRVVDGMPAGADRKSDEVPRVKMLVPSVRVLLIPSRDDLSRLSKSLLANTWGDAQLPVLRAFFERDYTIAPDQAKWILEHGQTNAAKFEMLKVMRDHIDKRSSLLFVVYDAFGSAGARSRAERIMKGEEE